MPVYDYQCQECGAVEEVQHKLAEEAPACDCGGQREKVFLKPNVGRVAGPKGPIWDMRQVKDSHGAGWRRTPGSDTPGGAGRKAFSHRSMRPGAGATTEKLPRGSWGGDL